MSYRPKKAQKTAQLLQDNSSLQRLVQRAQNIDRLQQLLNQCLQPAGREHCYLATLQETTLTLIVTDGHWATRLRYQQKRLLQQLQQVPEFNQVLRIQFKYAHPCSLKKHPRATLTFQSTPDK